MSADSDRIDTLEAHVAFQGDTIRQLNEALVAQQKRIDRLQVQFERFVAQRDEAGDGQGLPPDERPPHY